PSADRECTDPRCARLSLAQRHESQAEVPTMKALTPQILLMSGLALFTLGLHAQVADVAEEDIVTINGCALVRGTACPGVDLRQADLRHKDLSKADFTGADLRGADLRHAKLDQAKLDNARLDGANFNRASLQQTAMRGASAIGSSFVAVQAWNLNAQGGEFRQADFTGANLEFARFSAARMHEVILRAANLEMAWLPKADLKGADLSDANLQESKMNHANLESATMTGTRLHYGTYLNMHMTNCTDCPVDGEAHLSSQARYTRCPSQPACRPTSPCRRITPVSMARWTSSVNEVTSSFCFRLVRLLEMVLLLRHRWWAI